MIRSFFLVCNNKKLSWFIVSGQDEFLNDNNLCTNMLENNFLKLLATAIAL